MFKINIEKKSISNKAYRKVIETTPQMQLVLMSIPVGSDIHMEKHKKTTQFIRIEKGTGQAIIMKGKTKKRYTLKDGDSIVIHPNTYHQIKNKGKTPLKLYALYSPPEHKPNLVQKNRPDDSNEE